MTTHNRDKVIAAANKCFLECNGVTFPQVERFYAIAFEDGRSSEREETNRRPLPDNTAPYIRARGDRNEYESLENRAIV